MNAQDGQRSGKNGGLVERRGILAALNKKRPGPTQFERSADGGASGGMAALLPFKYRSNQ